MDNYFLPADRIKTQPLNRPTSLTWFTDRSNDNNRIKEYHIFCHSSRSPKSPKVDKIEETSKLTMSVKLAEQKLPPQSPEDFVPSPPPTDLIFDDGEPLESNRHRIGINVLIESLHEAYRGRNDYFAGGNMFLYFSRQQVKNKDFRGPDFFVVLDVDGTRERQGWVIWEEQGRYPDVIIELMSPSTANTDLDDKRKLYERTFRTRNYFVYNPFNPESLQGWRLGATGRYEELTPSDRGWLWCDNLELWLGTWEGTILRETAPWLRFYDANENLVLLAEEREQQRADREQQRADRLAQLLIDNGIAIPDHDD